MRPMSVGEVQHRFSAPEALNLAELSKMMRRCHSADSVCHLGQPLLNAACIELFTSLTELANDLNTLAWHTFPVDKLPNNTPLPTMELNGCLTIEMVSTLPVRYWVNSLPYSREIDHHQLGNTYASQLLDDTLQTLHLNDFSSLTPGFGRQSTVVFFQIIAIFQLKVTNLHSNHRSFAIF